jgi:hypothetical protein
MAFAVDAHKSSSLILIETPTGVDAPARQAFHRLTMPWLATPSLDRAKNRFLALEGKPDHPRP